MSISDWERSTPAQFYAWVSGYINRTHLEDERLNHAVYNLASLIRSTLMAREMPEYSSVFGGNKNEQMTDEAMYERVRALNAMFGGTE